EDDVFAVCPRIQQRGQEQGSRTAGFWQRGLIFYRPLEHSPVPTDCFFAVGGQSIFNRAKLDEIGSIDPLLWPMYHEDIELSYRAWKRGWRVRYAPDAVVDHVGGHTSRRVFTPTQLRSFVRQNEFLTVWKNVTDRKLVAAHVIWLLPRVLAALAKRDWATLIGLRHALARFPAALRARKSARIHARLTDAEVFARVNAIS
ncbi:MAG TPA: glycosyltransferase, partial [Dermatophilaceae bacterium]